MENTFKIGERVRLKAYVTKTKLAGLDNLFPQGCVGIVTRTTGNVQGIPYLQLRVPTLEKAYHRVCVAVEDLELMPERQVHFVRGGKVYEMRKCCPPTLSCDTCRLRRKGKPCPDVCSPWNNYQEVASGKLVS